MACGIVSNVQEPEEHATHTTPFGAVGGRPGRRHCRRGRRKRVSRGHERNIRLGRRRSGRAHGGARRVPARGLRRPAGEGRPTRGRRSDDQRRRAAAAGRLPRTPGRLRRVLHAVGEPRPGDEQHPRGRRRGDGPLRRPRGDEPGGQRLHRGGDRGGRVHRGVDDGGGRRLRTPRGADADGEPERRRPLGVDRTDHGLDTGDPRPVGGGNLARRGGEPRTPGSPSIGSAPRPTPPARSPGRWTNSKRG